MTLLQFAIALNRAGYLFPDPLLQRNKQHIAIVAALGQQSIPVVYERQLIFRAGIIKILLNDSAYVLYPE